VPQDPNTTKTNLQSSVILDFRWILIHSLHHARDVAARASEGTEGTDATFLFENIRRAISEFTDNHPAMLALAREATARSFDNFTEEGK
jgi:hypothetical protein